MRSKEEVDIRTSGLRKRDDKGKEDIGNNSSWLNEVSLRNNENSYDDKAAARA